MEWLGKRNGELLGLMNSEGFDAFVTIDKNLQYQQNLDRFSVRLFVLNAPNNRLDTLQPFVKSLVKIANQPREDRVVIVDPS